MGHVLRLLLRMTPAAALVSLVLLGGEYLVNDGISQHFINTSLKICVGLCFFFLFMNLREKRKKTHKQLSLF